MPKPDDKIRLYPEVRVGVMVPKPVADWIAHEARKESEQPILFLRQMILNLYKNANPIATPIIPTLEMKDERGNKTSTLTHISHPGIE